MSNIFTLNWADLGKGIVTAFLTALLTSVYNIINLGNLPTTTDLMLALKIAGVAGIAYLLKNLLTNDQGELFAPNRNQQ